MSKTQAFIAFRIIVGCLFWIMKHLAYQDQEANRLWDDMVLFLAREHPNG